jgi:hypothetical protein
VDIKTKKCTMCKQELSLSLFRHRGGKSSHLLKSRCNKCLYSEHRRWIKNNPEKVKEYRYKDGWTLVKRCRRRGISPSELIDRYERQEGCCAICFTKIDITNSAIDHNHNTEEFRGVLCKQCNRALGMFKDSPKILLSALEYLLNYGSYGCEDFKNENIELYLSARKAQMLAKEYKAKGGAYKTKK